MSLDISIDAIDGVGSKTADELRENGYQTIESLQQADPANLHALDGIGESLAADIVSRAQTIKEDLARDHVHDRVRSLPKGVLECPSCDSDKAMRVRRSSLRPTPCADDVVLKCVNCYQIQTHGIPISRKKYERELKLRPDGRVLDYVEDGPNGVEENLTDLGYIDY